MKPIISKTILVALALSVAACSSTPVRRSMKETWNDSLTASKIRYKMMRDSEVKKSRLHVEVFRGQVTLTGRAVTDVEKTRAETLAKSVKRVIGVENYVHVVGGSDTAVAKAPVVGVPIVAVSPKASAAPTPVIQEKTIVTEKVKVKVAMEEDDTIASLPTIREATGRPAVVPTAPVVAGNKAAAPKAATAVARNGKVAKGEPAKPVTKPATVTKRATAPATGQTTVPATKVVGQSKTGLPWDGEVYEDDATRVTGPTKTTTAARTPVGGPVTTPAPVPAATPPPTTGDDLAVEAAQELEKLRQKK